MWIEQLGTRQGFYAFLIVCIITAICIALEWKDFATKRERSKRKLVRRQTDMLRHYYLKYRHASVIGADKGEVLSKVRENIIIPDSWVNVIFLRAFLIMARASERR